MNVRYFVLRIFTIVLGLSSILEAQDTKNQQVDCVEKLVTVLGNQNLSHDQIESLLSKIMKEFACEDHENLADWILGSGESMLFTPWIVLSYGIVGAFMCYMVMKTKKIGGEVNYDTHSIYMDPVAGDILFL